MDRHRDHDSTVRHGYNQMAERYLAERDQSESTNHLEYLISELEPEARVLDVGFGAGMPVDSFLTENGCRVSDLVQVRPAGGSSRKSGYGDFGQVHALIQSGGGTGPLKPRQPAILCKVPMPDR